MSQPSTLESAEVEGFVVNHRTLEAGMTLACFFLPCYIDEEPQIGRLVSIEGTDDSNIEVE